MGNVITLNNFVGVVAPKVLWAYKRYKRDIKKNIYKVGGVFYTTRSGYGLPGRCVMITEVKDIYFPNKEDGIMGRRYAFREVEKDHAGKLVPSNKDLGGVVYTTFELFQKDDPKIKDVEFYNKHTSQSFPNKV